MYWKERHRAQKGVAPFYLYPKQQCHLTDRLSQPTRLEQLRVLHLGTLRLLAPLWGVEGVQLLMTAEQAAPCQCDNWSGEGCTANHHGNKEKEEETLAGISLRLPPSLPPSPAPVDCELSTASNRALVKVKDLSRQHRFPHVTGSIGTTVLYGICACISLAPLPQHQDVVTWSKGSKHAGLCQDWNSSGRVSILFILSCVPCDVFALITLSLNSNWLPPTSTFYSFREKYKGTPVCSEPPTISTKSSLI